MASTRPSSWPAERLGSAPDRRRSPTPLRDHVDTGFPEHGRVLALDLGDRRIGVAVCDEARLVATPYETVNRMGDRPREHDRLEALVDETGATMIVVGLPMSLDGNLGPAARKVLSEVKALRRRLAPRRIPVVTQDERHSTTTAADSLRRQGVRGRDRREMIDQVAASVVLQHWIDGRG